jgi:scyllo-inositol 2-dehydrogenase (NADP+)
MAKEIGAGVIGFGLACRVFHAPFLSAVPGLALRGIVQRSGNEAAEDYPAAHIARSVDELLEDPAIDLIVVATPNETHFELARQALNAGKHVVVDKPFAATGDEALELIALAASKGLVLAPFHNRRWDGDFLTVRTLLERKAIGRLVTFASHFDRFRPVPRENTWKEAGNPANGMLFDLGPHLVDQCLALFGVPAAIAAGVRTDRDGSAIEDAFDITLHYPGYEGHGLLASCHASYLACDASPRFLLHGTAGSFRKYGLDPQEPTLLSGKRPPMQSGIPDGWLEEDASHWGSLTVAPVLSDPGTLVKTVEKTLPGDYRLFYANVRDAILGAAQLAVPPEAGYRVIHLLELARVSSAERRTVSVAF